MLNERNIGPREDLRESLFLERYQRLLAWAMRLTKYDRAGAEDLVQDAFIQFTRGRTSLDTITNVDGYLRRMLHYLNLARVARHTEQMHRQSLSIADYDSLSLGLRVFDIERHLQVKEQLIDICRYACIRKQTSRAGSVLILRFFHEYSPSEIGKLLCRPRHSVDEWQRVARTEVKNYLTNPRQFSFLRSKSVAKTGVPNAFIGPTDLTKALRQMIFNSRLGDCLTVDKLKDIYVSETLEQLTPSTLAHIVSCRRCLDGANLLLGLPPLSERFDVDDHDHFEPPNNGNGSDWSGDIRRRLSKHVREVVEHKPRQLRIRVNGLLVSSFGVECGGGEFHLNLSPAQNGSFIEVSSEQGVPFLLFEARAQAESWGQIDLSEGRLLEVGLSENTLSVIYHAPERVEASEREPLRLVLLQNDEMPVVSEDTFWQRLKSTIKAAPFLRAAWLSPACITLLVAFLLVVTSLRTHTSPGITASNLLERALVAEQQHNSVPGHVTRRVITFEELQPTGTVVSRQRIEIWQDATNGARADRVFDDHNHLLAEQLQNKNSGSAVFHHAKTESMSLSAENIFQLQLTTSAFEMLVGPSADLALEQRPGLYVISYSGRSITRVGQLLKATLTLSALDLHPIEQTLVIERSGQIREYRFIEVRFDQLARQEVDSAVFQPTAETKSSEAVSRISVGGNSFSSEARRTAAASAELEIEVAYLVDKAKADHNEQVTLLRDKNGSLRIDGVVETSARKNELLQTFTPLSNNRSVSINIQVADAVSAQELAKHLEWSTLRSSNRMVDRIAVDRELREYLSKTRSDLSHGSDLDGDVSAFASQTVNRSYRALFHAVELKQLADRFSNTNMRSITAEARDKWHEMIRSHAEAFKREYAILRTELEPIFHSQGSPDLREQQQIDNDEQLITAVQELSRLARTNNEALRAAFTISAQGSTVPLNSKQFWNDLVDAQQTAVRIARY